MQRLDSLLLCRQQKLTEELNQRQAEAAEAASELARAQEVCREMLNARRNAREALSDMAQQNARLVSAYVEKKQELRQMQDGMRDERLQWQVSTGCWLAGRGGGQHAGQAAAKADVQDALEKLQWQGTLFKAPQDGICHQRWQQQLSIKLTQMQDSMREANCTGTKLCAKQYAGQVMAMSGM